MNILILFQPISSNVGHDTTISCVLYTGQPVLCADQEICHISWTWNFFTYLQHSALSQLNRHPTLYICNTYINIILPAQLLLLTTVLSRVLTFPKLPGYMSHCGTCRSAAMWCCVTGWAVTDTRVATLIVATIYLQLIQNRYMFRSFTVLQCSHQHCVQPVASDVEVVGYL